MTIYSLAVLLFLFGTSLLFHVHFELFYSSNLSLFLLLSARLFVTILFTIIPPALSMCFLCFSLFLPAAAAAKSLQSCPTLCDPTDGSPPGSPPPWDSPGKNTGVGCHFLLQCMKVKSEREVAQLYPTLHDPMNCSLPGSSVHGIFQARVLEWGAIHADH